MTPSRFVELQGGPCDGQRMPVADDAEVLLFRDEPIDGMVAAYRLSDRSTIDGLKVFEWTGTNREPPPP